MRGLHLTADLHHCTGAALHADGLALRELVLAAVRRAGLTPVGDLFHPFPGGGVTGVVLLAESHVALHTWPELGAATLDVYVCNVGADNSEQARTLLAALEATFEPGVCDRQRVQRARLRATA